MTKRFSGPPPSVGWWPASMWRDSNAVRWWNGKFWSITAYPGMSSRQAAACARQQTWASASDIEWCHRPESWPARSKT
jgi:hypothetical protein